MSSSAHVNEKLETGKSHVRAYLAQKPVASSKEYHLPSVSKKLVQYAIMSSGRPVASKYGQHATSVPQPSIWLPRMPTRRPGR